MDSSYPVVNQFYAAIHGLDRRQLLDCLDVDFVGRVTEGLPGIGGAHHGPTAMFERAWLPAYRTYWATPYPETTIVASDDTVVVLGHYRGVPPVTGTSFEAVFAHVFTLRNGKIAELRQITDSQRWVDAASLDGATTAVVRQVFDAVRARDLDLLLEAYAEDIVIHDDPSLPYGGTHKGREGALIHSIGFVRTWDHLQDNAARDPGERILASGGTAAALWTLKAVRGDDRFAQPAASLFTVEKGKVAELRMLHADTAATLRFLAAG
jgi:ketosteroid isomerase-like protein